MNMNKDIWVMSPDRQRGEALGVCESAVGLPGVVEGQHHLAHRLVSRQDSLGRRPRPVARQCWRRRP